VPRGVVDLSTGQTTQGNGGLIGTGVSGADAATSKDQAVGPINQTQVVPTRTTKGTGGPKEIIITITTPPHPNVKLTAEIAGEPMLSELASPGGKIAVSAG
jgi:hypothetical protein